MGERTKFSLFILFSVFFCLISSTVADDAAIMSKLAASLSPTPSGWSGSDSCKWTSVSCEGSSVTSIWLASKSLSGTLPSDLNQLTQLKILFLQNNQITGPLPSLANMTNLQEVHLEHNNFTSIPSSFFTGLTSLQNFSINCNPNLSPWSIPEDLTDSTSLVTLYAGDANVMGTLPDIFEAFPSLLSLKLSDNNLTGPLPKSLGKTGIQNLWLHNQTLGLSGPIDVLGEMTQLAQVWLYGNAFSGSIPDLSQCTSLVDLQLRDNQFIGVVPSSLTSLPSLVKVSLAYNKLQGPVPSFRDGVEINFGTTNYFCNPKPGPCAPQVTALLAVAGALGYPQTLAESWEGNDPCQDWTFITCDPQKKNVTVIIFARKNFTGTISPAFANLTSLRSLIVNDNNLFGPIPDSLTALNQLQVLDVSNNNLSGPIPAFPSGVLLKLSGNRLLENNSTPGGEGGGSNAPSPNGSPSGKPKTSSVLVGMVAGTVIAISILIIGVVPFVFYKCYTKKSHQIIGLDPNTQKEKKNNIQLFNGGNIAISVQVLRQATNNFSEDNILGRGGFGVVYKGELHDGTQIAVKRMISASMGTKGMKEFQAEIEVLTKVRHRHLVALLGFCIKGNEKLLVYEYMPQGTLGQHLFDWNENRYIFLTWKQRVTIALDVARGVEYLHNLAQQSFIHRDLKPSNILLGDDMRAKVADFGLVKHVPDGKYSVETRFAGTFGYLPPEYSSTGRVTTKVDVYAFGVVLMELITGRKSLDESLPEETSHLVTWFSGVLINKDNIRKAIDPNLEPNEETFGNICELAELAGHCTSHEPSQRPDMGHVVNVLAPLVKQWKPACLEEERIHVDPQMSLPRDLQRWQANEGTSEIADDSYYNGGMMNLRNTI